MTTRILIMGLPGAGKTTLALNLLNYFSPDVLWLNADEIRRKFDDWDFSYEGRIRQKVKGTAEKPRLSIFRSNNHIYAQLIDDVVYWWASEA